MGRAIVVIETSPETITFKTKKKIYSYPWDKIKETVIEKKEVRCGYPGGITTETRILIIRTEDHTFKINVSHIRAEIENHGAFVKEIKEHVNIKEKRK